jgi:thiamine biosynthesis lipoprotein
MEALEVVAQLERLLSVYKQRSELSVLNRFGGTRAVAISHDTLTLLELARDLHKLTAGAFDITAARLSETWGFSRREGSVPTQAAIEAALQQVGGQYVQTDSQAKTARFLREGVQVNPGGIGKGYALDRAIGRLIDQGIENFMIHGGLSSVAARGDRQHSATGGGWLVAVKHPWRWEEKLGTLRLRNQALGTSGSGKQFFHFGGQRYSHIIDPRSGWPAQGMMSATVICPSGAVADALATAFFVMGPELSRRFCEQHPQIGSILIYSEPKSGRQRIETCNLTEDTWRAGSD